MKRVFREYSLEAEWKGEPYKIFFRLFKARVVVNNKGLGNELVEQIVMGAFSMINVIHSGLLSLKNV